MRIDEQQLDALLSMLVLTKDAELDCDECWRRLAEFAETKLSGKTIPEGLECIEEHLNRCEDCQEEFAALKVALASEYEND